MRKNLREITVMFGILTILAISALPIASAETAWSPPETLTGWTRIYGQEISFNNDFVLIPVTGIRFDVWAKGSTTSPDAIVVSLNILNDTNVLDGPLPAELSSAIQSYIQQLPQGYTVHLDTIWDLLTLAIPLVANLAPELNLRSDHFDNEDYYYLEEALLVWNQDVSVAIAKDQNMALFCASFPTDPNVLADIQANIQIAANNLMNLINTVISQGLAGAGFGTVASPQSASTTTEPESDPNVLDVMDKLSEQYGNNDYSPENPLSNIPGFPIEILGLITLLAVAGLIAKRK